MASCSWSISSSARLFLSRDPKSYVVSVSVTNTLSLLSIKPGAQRSCMFPENVTENNWRIVPRPSRTAEKPGFSWCLRNTPASLSRNILRT